MTTRHVKINNGEMITSPIVHTCHRPVCVPAPVGNGYQTPTTDTIWRCDCGKLWRFHATYRWVWISQRKADRIVRRLARREAKS